MVKYFAGVDTGRNGCCWVLDRDGNTKTWFDLPQTDGQISDMKFNDKIEGWNRELIIFTLENPQFSSECRVRKSKNFEFLFGRNYQKIESPLNLLGFKIQHVSPMQWKSWFKLVNENKEKSSILASEMNEKYKEVFRYHLNRKGVLEEIFKHDRADAYLIAEYGRLKYLNKIPKRRRRR